MTQPPRPGQPGQASGSPFGSGTGGGARPGGVGVTMPPAPGASPPAPGTAPPGYQRSFASGPAPQSVADAPTAAVPTVHGAKAVGSGGAAPDGAGAGFPEADGGYSNQSARTASESAGRSRARGPRRARLQLRHIDSLTVLKFSCVLAIALFFVWLIIVGVLFGVLDGAGVIDKINNAVTKINGGASNPPITAGIVFGGAAIIGVINIVLFVALTTIGSVVYNLCADLVGGIEVTLSER